MVPFSYANLSRPWKWLITGFLLILGAGYLAGALNAALSVGIDAAAIADHYRDQTLSHQEMAEMADAGFVEEEIDFDAMDDMGDMADDGAMGHDMAGAAGMVAAPSSISPQQMAGLAHVHLLGFSMILLSAGALICLTGLGDGLKGGLVLGLFLGLSLDIGGLYLVRFVSENFALLNMMAGITIGVCLLIGTVRVLWELWLTPA